MLDSKLDNGNDYNKYRSTNWAILGCIATVLCPEFGREYEEKFVPEANDNLSFDPVSLTLIKDRFGLFSVMILFYRMQGSRYLHLRSAK